MQLQQREISRDSRSRRGVPLRVSHSASSQRHDGHVAQRVTLCATVRASPAQAAGGRRLLRFVRWSAERVRKFLFCKPRHGRALVRITCICTLGAEACQHHAQGLQLLTPPQVACWTVGVDRKEKSCDARKSLLQTTATDAHDARAHLPFLVLLLMTCALTCLSFSYLHIGNTAAHTAPIHSQPIQ